VQQQRPLVYLDAVAGAFGNAVDYARLVKLYGEDPRPSGDANERKYSPGECVGARREPIIGMPDHAHISTSHVERHNLTMRMAMTRFGRLTNAFSRKIDNHIHSCHTSCSKAFWGQVAPLRHD
jgi:hypothetical protein